MDFRHNSKTNGDYDLLKELALNLIWSWSHKGDELWKQLDLDLWIRTQNPWAILQKMSQDTLQKALSNSEFRTLLDELISRDRESESRITWFQETHPDSPLTSAVYFSMEYMLSEALPIYSGGLGNVAGDQLKAASDLGIPIVGIGLLYQQGYFRQVIDAEGNQIAFYPFNSPEQLPIRPLRASNGEWLKIEISFPGWAISLRTWEVRVGRRRLYLLDTNDIANYPPHRGINSELYGGSVEIRFQQELILGIGGWKLLDLLGITPEVCHLNEGHAAFAVLQRAKHFMNSTGLTFDEALTATRAGNLFTTHTAVPAGFDRFPPEMVERYLGKYAENELKISLQDLLALGRVNPTDSEEPFNMAYLALRTSAKVNGVSKLHGHVSRSIFQDLFPRCPREEVPIDYVTNGVHVPSWHSATSNSVWVEHCGRERWLGTTEELEEKFKAVSDEMLWDMRNKERQNMIEYGRERIQRVWKARGAADEDIALAKNMFNTKALTMGFSRRFATYKRANMLLHDKERLLKILTNTEKPVQLVLSGKAHPADKPGQALIQEWMQFIHHPEVRPYIIFLPDYDMQMATGIVAGVDLWINTPRRPWEACGTSGMKVLANGGLNVSELDGWWAEAYCPEVGWALGDGKDRGDDPEWDAQEAEQLYDLLEKEIIPEFYNRNENDLPTAWITRVRESMARLTPHYSANRSVREYTEQCYIPAAKRYKERSSDKGAPAKKIVEWKHSIQEKWPKLKFEKVDVQSEGKEHRFEASMDLGGLDSQEILVELYAGAEGELPIVKLEMKGNGPFKTSVANDRPADRFTVRATPRFPDVAVPLELPLILWQK